ncbi:MAG: isochorismatase family protein [Oligoflexia bacterium]|nr:isochorismatase family protein [Oligoflexia bacterium]
MPWKKLITNEMILVLIDFQDGFAPLMKPKIYQAARANAIILLKMCKELSIPLVGTEHYRRGIGPTAPQLMEIWNLETDKMIEKITFSCWGTPAFANTLTDSKRKTVILIGIETHICVLQTALDLLEQGFSVIVIADAVVSSTKLKWQNGIDLMRTAGAHILNTETLLFYILKRADSKEFKYLVRLLKDAKSTCEIGE